MRKNKNTNNSDKASDFLFRAEKYLQNNKRSSLDISSSPEEVLRIVHELEVRQVQLEMQKEELIHSRNELLESQEKLEKSFDRYTELYDMAPIGYLTLSRIHTILEINLTATKMLGSERSTLHGKPFRNFIAPEDISLLNAMLDKVFTKDERGICEVKLFAHDGLHHLEQNHIPQRNTVQIEAVLSDDGQECRLVMNDITERKRVENLLKTLSKTIEQSPDAVVITDPVGNIQFVNPKYTQVTGYSAEEVKGKNIRDIRSGLTPKAIYEDLWKTILSGRVWRGELQNKKKNGKFYWESAVISAILGTNGEITNYVSIMEDITLKKRILRELVSAKEDAEESDRLSTDFLSNISYEMRTPMNGLLGFSELLKNPALSEKEKAKYIDIIHQSGQRMLTLINDLIDLTSIEAGETTLQVMATPVNSLLRDINAVLKPELNQAGVFLHLSTGLPDDESIIETDGEKLKRILTNLVQKVMRFASKGCVEFGYVRNHEHLEFHVFDAVPGISFDIQNNILERVTQKTFYSSFENESTGIGLSISNAYVEMLGGAIRVESVEGRVKGFSFTLPYKPLAALNTGNLSHVQAQDIDSLSGMTILIVDDDEVSRYLFKMNLKGENVSLLFAGDGLEAIAQVRSHPKIDIVLMDLKMPKMDGFEATREIKQMHPALPVIAQTAYISPEDREKAKEAGCDSFITKPIFQQELFMLIQEVLCR